MLPSARGRASSACRTSSVTGPAFNAAKIPALSRSPSASRTSVPLSPATAAAPAPSHSPATNSGSCVM